MSTHQREAVRSARDEMRHEPTGARVRGMIDGRTVVDSTDALLVWEPRRYSCMYAVPAAHIAGELAPARPSGDLPQPPDQWPIFPNVPFAVHTSAGSSLEIRVGDRILEAAAFAPDDPDLGGRVLLDFAAFDAWYEEDEEVIGGPRDPYHRVDSRPTSRRVRVEAHGIVLAESDRAVALFEATVPPRFYLPREDIRVPLHPTSTRTVCPYKGWASYWSAEVAGTELTDVAWSYDAPLPDSERIGGLVSFDDSAVQVIVATT